MMMRGDQAGPSGNLINSRCLTIKISAHAHFDKLSPNGVADYCDPVSPELVEGPVQVGEGLRQGQPERGGGLLRSRSP